MLTCSFVLQFPPPPRSTLFPYTTLFRSRRPPRGRLPHQDGRGDAPLPCGRAPRGGHGDAARRDRCHARRDRTVARSEEHTSELQSPDHLVCRLLLEKKKNVHALPSP